MLNYFARRLVRKLVNAKIDQEVNKMIATGSGPIVSPSSTAPVPPPVPNSPISFSGRIKYDYFKKVEMKIGKIIGAEAIVGSDKLLKLAVDFAEPTGPRQIVSGIAQYFPDQENLIGRKCTFVTNLEPKPLMGLESNGMILAVGEGDSFSLLEVQSEALVGRSLR
jgi:methionine--tRNA ligase beta chain